MRSTVYCSEPNNMRYIVTLLALALLPLIHGCAVVAVGGAAAGGYLLGEDRRPVSIMSDDKQIEARVVDRVRPKYPDAHVNATSYNRWVLLTGEVPNDVAKRDIENLAKGVEN